MNTYLVCVIRENDAVMIDQLISKLLQDHGWYYTANFSSYGMPNGVDIHTHGLFENFQHRDLQICLPVTADDLEQVAWLFDEIIGEIKKGNHFEANKRYMGILPDHHILSFADAIVGGRKYLRILYPDPQGSLEEFPYDSQLTLLSDGSSLKALHYDIADITNVAEAARFILVLNTEYNINFHPDTVSQDYLSISTGKLVFNQHEAALVDTLSHHCRSVISLPYCIYVIAENMAVVRHAMTPNAWMKNT